MLLDPLTEIFSNDLAIDIETANTFVYVKGLGYCLERALCCGCQKRRSRNQQSSGYRKRSQDDAWENAGNIEAVRPVKDGVIADFEITEAMLRHFIRKAHNPRTLVRHRIIVWGNRYVLYIYTFKGNYSDFILQASHSAQRTVRCNNVGSKMI